MKKLALVALMAVAGSAVADGTARDTVELYNRTCTVCHASGTAGAPKTHDAAAWAPRLSKGMDVLVASVKNGLNAMPPRGLCMDCTDAEYKALIEYMSK
jgi:cytochrome c5